MIIIIDTVVLALIRMDGGITIVGKLASAINHLLYIMVYSLLK